MRSHLSARSRLTLLYTSLFALGGAALVLVTYLLVEHDHVVVGARRALQGCRAVVDHVDSETRVAQTLTDPVGQRNVILHD